MRYMLYLSAVLSLLLPAGASAAGAIAGQVELLGKGVRDAVVYVDSIPGKRFDAPGKHPVMDQKNMAFVPRVLPILAGATVDFLNSDSVQHNVFTPDKCAGRFNLGIWADNERRSHTFEKAGCQAVLLCSLHPEMAAYVVVLPTPYFAKTDEKGHYLIEAVPTGEYTVKVWRAKPKGAAPVERRIAVPGRGQVEANFTLNPE